MYVIKGEVMDKLKLEERNLDHSTIKMRKNNIIPGVIFGKKMDSFPVSIDRSELVKVLSKSGELYEIHTGSHKLQAKFDEIQRDPVSGKILHFSLMHLPKGQAGKIEIPINFTGVAAGSKEGGIFQTVIESIEIEALPKDFPKELVCDISGMEIGDNLTIANLQYDRNKITINEEDDKTIAVCVAPKPVVEEAEETETVVITAESSEETTAEASDAPTEEKSE